MTRLTQLPQIAQETLGGLHADERLYQKIRQAQALPRRRRSMPVRALALATSFVFLFGIGALSLRLLGGGMQVPEIHTQQAGSIPAGARMAAYDVPRGSITLADAGVVPKYVGVWAGASGGNFPLLRVDGRYYRLLTNPSEVERNMLGGELGSVATHTAEPALDTGRSLLSNIVPKGGKVYALSGMSGTAVAAELDGKLRVFQRVSFAGSALIGGESLGDTLRGNITGLQISGLGSITEPGKVQELVSSLLRNASYQSSSSRSTDRALLIRFANGIVLQMALQDSRLSACGSWEAEGFLQDFEEALQ